VSSEELEAELLSLVERSLANKKLKEEIVFDIPPETIKIAWRKYFIDLRNFTCKVHSDEIRHIKKEHPDDVYHICKIHYYLAKFASVERSSTRDIKTGKDIPCLVFVKKFHDKKIQIVKLNLSRKKILSLKTLFEK